jgi:hypothetical protein
MSPADTGNLQGKNSEVRLNCVGGETMVGIVRDLAALGALEKSHAVVRLAVFRSTSVAGNLGSNAKAL